MVRLGAWVRVPPGAFKMEKSKLAKLKQEYEKIRKKYNLPSFKQLNEDFDIERITKKETELLTREVRWRITEKVSSAMRFLELFLNPATAPLFILSALKGIGAEARKLIEKSYNELVELEIASLNLDLAYDERSEAKFIKDAVERWVILSSNIKEVNRALGEALNLKEKTKKDYFG